MRTEEAIVNEYQTAGLQLWELISRTDLTKKQLMQQIAKLHKEHRALLANQEGMKNNETPTIDSEVSNVSEG